MNRKETADRISALLADVVDEIDSYYDEQIPRGLQEERPDEWKKLIDEMNDSKELVNDLQEYLNQNT